MNKFTYLFEPDAPHDVNALTVTVKEVWDQLDEHGPISFDLSNISAASSVHLAVTLRALNCVRDRIQGYEVGLQRCIELCAAQQIDINDALAGMI